MRTEFDKYQLQRFDNTGWYSLDNYHLLSYTLVDNHWSERNLKAYLFIDLYYECKLELHYTNRKNKSVKTFFIKRSELISDKIKELISELLKIEKFEIKKNVFYADLSLEGEKKEYFVTNHIILDLVYLKKNMTQKTKQKP